MNDTFRYILAGGLIFLIIILQPVYLEWLGYDTGTVSGENLEVMESESVVAARGKKIAPSFESGSAAILTNQGPVESFITIVTPLYTATLTNRSGGSFTNYFLSSKNADELKYIGGYNDGGVFNPNIPVSLTINSEENCMPCLADYDDNDDKYNFFNQPFALLNFSNQQDTIYLDYGSVELKYALQDVDSRTIINKTVSFSADKYINEHYYEINDEVFEYSNNLELLWYGGLRPSEEKEEEDVAYGSGIISQAGEIEDVRSTGPDETITREVYKGQTDWVAVRTKYFMSAIITENSGKYATLSGHNIDFGQRTHTPLYHASIGFPLDVSTISSSVYLGPLDVDYLSHAGASLDASMDWGFAPIRPISKGVLWVLKFMHNKLNLNYGLVLLLFAVLVRLITGPLTKKSYESSQNMQKIQPKIKKIQAKYKGDPQRLNKETMALYKTHKVNPLGGCLPIMLQMPLLWALFMVFRTTIEFRGAPFMLWISDLSKPDVVLALPFSIPIYGDGVAILPLVMGATLLLTMRMSSATMDKSQKPVMYFMNGFFILLFNTFPSGLNLYYTAYNMLSFFQQRSIKNKLANQ
ncbi:MAG: YidC/Oxa1 family insertase periplasmic-domain containing protein [Candidatus Marinimicrobia bacterium]|jgi:YidC/Oxa1 family membrane protein insertase|nr:YidC/Oxa1 family insertase periplasmic-domain containing protein [Candidatus Neomarinimicrobiota bacterium]